MAEIMKDEKRRMASMMSVRLAPEEEELVRAAAAEKGESISTFIREAALGRCGVGASAHISFAPTTTVSAGMAFQSGEDGIIRAKPSTGAYVRLDHA